MKKSIREWDFHPDPRYNRIETCHSFMKYQPTNYVEDVDWLRLSHYLHCTVPNDIILFHHWGLQSVFLSLGVFMICISTTTIDNNLGSSFHTVNMPMQENDLIKAHVRHCGMVQEESLVNHG